MNDAVTEQLFTNIVRDLGTARELIHRYLAISPGPSTEGPGERDLRRASENISNTIMNVQALAKRVTVDA